jgi:hypothetical protein
VGVPPLGYPMAAMRSPNDDGRGPEDKTCWNW